MMATEKENMAMTAETREQKPSMATCKEALADYRRIYLPVPAIEDRKPVFLSKETRDRLDRIVRLFGERKMSVSGFMGYLKGKSSLMIFQKYGNMKFAYRNREFWCKGYYVDTVGKNTAAITNYIANQLKKDREMDQLSLFDPRDPFTGRK